MATIRKTVFIPRPPDEVWKVVDDAGCVAEWFPLVEQAHASGARRVLVLTGGANLEEQIVTRDSTLRRFQYKVVGGDLPVEEHLATIDVLDVDSGSLVVYSTDVTPDALADIIDPALEGAVAGLHDKFAR